MVATLIQELMINSDSRPPYQLTKGILCYNGIIVVGEQQEMRQKIIQAWDDSVLGSHSGTRGTYTRLKQHFFWLGMNQEVMDYICSYNTCGLPVLQIKNGATTLPFP